jgi:ribonucleotide reductase alpha subunit
LHKFQYKDMEFSKTGQLDELIALDRYAIQSYDNYSIGSTVVFSFYNEQKQMDEKRVGEIVAQHTNDRFDVKDRFNEVHTIDKEDMHKPLETKPYQLWERWAKGGSSVEKTPQLQQAFENDLRWLYDGFRYSMGGRIQLMLGQEFVTGEKANLTAYNCYVLDVPKGKRNPLDQYLEVLRVAKQEIDIQRRGGGCGINISEINTIKGSGRQREFFNIIIPEDHKDYSELQERIALGKFDGVTVNAPILDDSKSFLLDDSTDGLYEGLQQTVKEAFENKEITQLNIHFNNIRHRNAIVYGVNGRSSGSVSWAELYVLIARLLQQETINNVEFAEIYSHITHLIEQG